MSLGGQLPGAIVGNGSLLVTLSPSGRVQRMFWPNVDWRQHAGELRLGIGGAWLDEAREVEQRYLDDSTALRTDLDGFELIDVVDPDRPLLARRVRGKARGQTFTVACTPRLDSSVQFASAHAVGGMLVFCRRDVAVAVALEPGGEARVTCTHGDAAGSLSVSFGGEVIVRCAFGASIRDALGTLAAADDFDSLLARRLDGDAARVHDALDPTNGDATRALYHRSLHAIDLLTNARTGAVIAAPELDPHFEHSGGYGFVWPRDLAFTALALVAAGRDDEAAAALRWLVDVQEPDGGWAQRYWSDGSPAPVWCEHQLDEAGAALFALATLGGPVDAVGRAAAYLRRTIDADTGLPGPTTDLWEEREGFHAFTAASVGAGLRAAGDEDAASSIIAAIERELVHDDRYARTLGDPTVDMSLLGLAWPFGVVAPTSPRMRATVDAIEQTLVLPNGGVLRYDGDTYAGGNPWLLGALWLGLYRRQRGDDDALQAALQYAIACQTPTGLLAEQVTHDGAPAWVVPLAWSHALFVLAARPELPVVAEATARSLAKTR